MVAVGMTMVLTRVIYIYSGIQRLDSLGLGSVFYVVRRRLESSSSMTGNS